MEDHQEVTTRTVGAARVIPLAPEVLYAAWTTGVDRWFAAPGHIRMTAEVGAPFWFETEFNGEYHPHYGRFLELEPSRVVSMTWVTGRGGTEGAETVVTARFTAQGAGTLVEIEHRGFTDDRSAAGHAEAWPRVLEHLESTLLGSDR